MTSNEDLDPDDVVRDVFRRHIVMAATEHLETLDLRSATRLADIGIVDEKALAEKIEIPNSLADIIRDRGHVRRLKVTDGPLIFYTTPSEQSEGKLIGLSDAILFSKREIRAAVVEYLSELAKLPDVIQQRTRDGIERLGPSIREEASKIWRPAALELSDLIADDWLFNLNGIRQCVTVGLDLGNSPFLQRVLRPTVRNIESIEIAWQDVIAAQRDPGSELDNIASSHAELPDALEAYFKRFGHVPCGDRASMARLVELWTRHHESQCLNLWQDLWKWAEENGSVIARYHACQICLKVPDQLSIDNLKTLWSEIASLLERQGDEDTQRSTLSESMSFRCELARHYCRHFSSLLPSGDGDRIASISWWMTEQFAGIFDHKPSLRGTVFDVAVATEAALSQNLWQLTQPWVTPSDLHYGTLFIKSIWTIALVAALTTSEMRVDENVGSHERQVVANAMAYALVSGFPVFPIAANVAIYQFQTASFRIVNNKEERIGDEEWLQIAAAVKSVNDLLDPQFLLGELRKWTQGNDEAEQYRVAMYLRHLTYTHAFPAKELWDLVSDAEWREKTLAKIAIPALQLLSEAIQQVQAVGQGLWTSHIPHFFARAMEITSDNQVRREVLFDLVVVSSLQTGTSSAVTRLLRGSNRAHLSRSVGEWRDRLKELHPLCGGFIASQIASLLGRCGPRGFDVLVKAVGHTDARIRLAAVVGLDISGDRRAGTYLDRMETDTDPRIRKRAKIRMGDFYFK